MRFVQQNSGMLERLQKKAMAALREESLDNVTDSAFALAPEFTPHYRAMVLELPGVAGYQLRVVGEMFSLTTLSYGATDSAIQRATRAAVRVLMVNMRDQASKWLRDNPEDR